MSSGQVFPTPSSAADTCGDVTAAEWYAPISYTYNDPYVTPYPSSTVDSQQWNQYARASISDESMNSYAFQHYQQQQHLGLYQPSLRDPTRPKSSPSTFGPFPDSINWPVTSSGLGIQYTSTAGQPTPVTSTFPSDMYQPYPVAERYGTYSPPEIRQPQPLRPYTTIAPNPAGIATAKRMRDEDDSADLSSNSNSKKRKRNSSVASADLSEDDRFLVQLKEDESLPWKEIATRFHTDRGKNFQVAALQMRYKRLREKFRMWDEKDIVALRQAAEYWDKYKWDIISQKMIEFGVTERWPPRQCAKKMQELEAYLPTATTAGYTPGLSQLSSPIDGPVQYAFMPLQ